MDFNTELIELISKIRGANYYAVHSPKEFKQRMDKNFDYMVTPLVFNLQLTMEAPGFEIQKVYGSPEANEATKEIMKINTLFPSEKEEETRGGLVLLHMKKRPGSENLLRLNVSYENRSGQQNSHFVNFEFPNLAESQEHYANKGVRKGIVLSRYATLLKNWSLHERTRQRAAPVHHRPVSPVLEIYQNHGIPPWFPGWEPQLSQWERQSQTLVVSQEYQELFHRFISYFKKEMEAIGDNSMKKETDLLELLVSHLPENRIPETVSLKK